MYRHHTFSSLFAHKNKLSVIYDDDEDTDSCNFINNRSLLALAPSSRKDSFNFVSPAVDMGVQLMMTPKSILN